MHLKLASLSVGTAGDMLCRDEFGRPEWNLAEVVVEQAVRGVGVGGVGGHRTTIPEPERGETNEYRYWGVHHIRDAIQAQTRAQTLFLYTVCSISIT